jgi:hypothetical protein
MLCMKLEINKVSAFSVVIKVLHRLIFLHLTHLETYFYLH